MQEGFLVSELQWTAKVTHQAHYEWRFTFVITEEDGGKMWVVTIQDWSKSKPLGMQPRFFTTLQEAKDYCEAAKSND